MEDSIDVAQDVRASSNAYNLHAESIKEGSFTGSSAGNTSGTVPQVKPIQTELTLVRANLTRVNSPLKPNNWQFPSYLLCTLLLFPFYLLPFPV